MASRKQTPFKEDTRTFFGHPRLVGVRGKVTAEKQGHGVQKLAQLVKVDKGAARKRPSRKQIDFTPIVVRILRSREQKG